MRLTTGGRLAAVALAALLSSAALAQRANFFTWSSDTLTSAAQMVKSGPGALVAMECFNPGATQTFLQFFDSAGAVVVGTTKPTLSWAVPPGSTTGMMTPYPTGGAYFSSLGMQAAAATTATGGAAPASPLSCDVFYR